MLRDSRTRSKLVAGAATLAVATALTLAPAAIQVGPFDDAAYAQGKSEDKGNKGDKANKGGKSSEKGNKGQGGDKEARGNSGKAFSETKVGKAWGKLLGKPEKPAKGSKKVASATASSTTETTTTAEYEPVHPSKLGSRNAKPAEAAIEAHIRNAAKKGYWKDNLNNPVNVMAQMELTARAMESAMTDAELAALEEAGYDTSGMETGGLTETELAALEALGFDPSFEDGELDSIANEANTSTDYEFVVDEYGNVECVGECEGVDTTDAQNAVNDAVAEATLTEYARLYEQSVDRLVNGGNKPLEDYKHDVVHQVSDHLEIDTYLEEADAILNPPEETMDEGMDGEDMETALVTE